MPNFLGFLNYFFSSHPVRFGDFNFLHFGIFLAILTSMRLKQNLSESNILPDSSLAGYTESQGLW